ncbi:hypothetical protein PsYK624_040140 [Phanerochaete sordida]|uniref:Uncharacterized protein n=1 Tax=Phanerochaete sordida TaxID=48140 RepID=A0A9P3G476_9APHY|nr:hypothetical protein PsYK624_040140 [Phanerochaete sordida]
MPPRSKKVRVSIANLQKARKFRQRQRQPDRNEAEVTKKTPEQKAHEAQTLWQTFEDITAATWASRSTSA